MAVIIITMGMDDEQRLGCASIVGVQGDDALLEHQLGLADGVIDFVKPVLNAWRCVNSSGEHGRSRLLIFCFESTFAS